MCNKVRIVWKAWHNLQAAVEVAVGAVAVATSREATAAAVAMIRADMDRYTPFLHNCCRHQLDNPAPQHFQAAQSCYNWNSISRELCRTCFLNLCTEGDRV